MTETIHAPQTTGLDTQEREQLKALRAHRKAHRQKQPLADLARATRRPDGVAKQISGQPGQFSGNSPETIPGLPPGPLATEPPSLGQRLADTVARTIGSWRFIIVQSTAIVIWITGNVLTGQSAWDPYPFILLNLLLSFQAAYTAPAIMMSQNRQSEQDRRHAENDYEINVKAELEIELLHDKIDLLKERELLALTEAVRDLSAKLESMTAQVVLRPSAAA